MNDKSKLFQLIKAYNEATYALGKEMYDIKVKHGGKVLEDITTFSTYRLDTLCWFGSVYDQIHQDIIPETTMEFLYEKTLPPSLYLQGKTLKTSQLRKLIRKEKSKKSVKSKDNVIKTNSWQKHVLLLENEMKNMDPKTKARALAHLSNSILTIK